MDEESLRREILEDMGSLLRDNLAAEAWGRLQIEVVRAPNGEPAVAGIDVEEIVGDEGLVDAAFSQPSADLLATLAKATDALCSIDDVDLESVAR